MISIECRCGNEMRFADELEGRTAICPACKGEHRIAMDPIRSIRIDQEFGPDVPREKREPRWWQSMPIMICAGISFGTIGLGLVFAPEHKPAPKPAVELDVPERVAAEQPSFAFVVNPTPDQIRQWRPYARYCAEYAFESWFRDDKGVTKFTVSDLVVEASPADPRKVSWLWTAKLVADVQYRAGELKGEPRRRYCIDSMFRMVPPNSLQFYWHDLAVCDDPAQAHKRSHFKETSEWRPDFRKSVKSAKAEAEKRGAGKTSDQEIAGWFNVTTVELNEIIGTPD